MPKEYTQAELVEMGKKVIAQRQRNTVRKAVTNRALTILKERHLGEYDNILQGEMKKS